MRRFEIEHDYFEWIFGMICDGRYAQTNSYRKLLTYLHEVEFTYLIPNDADRACDGVSLRRRYALLTNDYEYVMDCLDGPCSVLEMMVALAIRCEETIMTDPKFGDRTGQWFWKMIVNLGLGSMADIRFDERYVKEVVASFLKRDYEPNGRGGLFMIRNCKHDLRKVDIWCQMLWYLDRMI